MTEVQSITGVRNELGAVRSRGETIGLVPTMGALHDGHVHLIRKMKEQASFVVVTVFVNPTQFGPNEDYTNYPRTRERDRQICEEEGVNLVFYPDVEEMYPVEPAISFMIKGLTDHMCGKSRPGHFGGVLQVVNKLFNIIQPDLAIFGQKDIQQFALIDRMVQEFNHPVRLIIGDTVREADGLAMSSRNAYLNKKERKRAPLLYDAIKTVNEIVTSKPDVSVQDVLVEQEQRLKANDLKIDYLAVVNFYDLQPVVHIVPGSRYIVAGAVINGTTRLIDNLITDFKQIS
ncbi:MAG: pantoate--beta-alanine ligase [Cyclonatronaceae bacterium]